MSSTSTSATAPTVSIAASPSSIPAGTSAMLSVAASNATSVTVTGSDGSSYTMPEAGGSQKVTPSVSTSYTASATGTGGKASSTASITVTPAAPAPAPTVTLTANPTSVVAGSPSTLTVAATNATAVTLIGSDGSSYTLQASGGTQSVTPKATTTYTAAASGAGGKASAVVTVKVTAATSAAPTVAMSASPTTIAAGASSTLTVTAANATTVVVTGSDSSSYTLSSTGGTQAVNPAATTTYTAKAMNSAGEATATAVVTVSSAVTAATVTLVANPTSINFGSTSTLTAVAGNASAVVVSGSDGSSYTLSPTGGTQVVTPAATTTYTANATGTGGNASAVTTVTVIPAPPAVPTVTITASPATINAGGASTLMVVATNATGVVVTGTDGSSSTLAAIGGSLAVTPAGSTTYTAAATGAGGNASATATVTVVAAPPPPPAPTVTLAANPTSITSGGSSTLTVVAANALTVTVNGSDGSGFTLLATGGTQPVTPTKTTTYTVTASGTSGNATAVATVTVVPPAMLPTVTISASPTSIAPGASSTLTIAVTGATSVTVTGSDSSSYTLASTGGSQTVTPASTTTYTASATGSGGNATAFVTVTVKAPGSVQSINHVIFMLQENHTFDNYFGMLNPYRNANGMNTGDDGNLYVVDGIDDKLNTTNPSDEGASVPLFKLRSTCIDDDSSEWLSSYGDVNRYDFLTNRPIQQNGFVHTAEGFATSCLNSGTCNGQFTDTDGSRAMGYYDEGFLNYYYYMASQFAVSDRWFSPLASKSTPNRVATYSGGTTQGLVLDPGYDDHLGGVVAPPIFEVLDKANVSWKVYYTQTAGSCLAGDDCGSGSANEPATDLGYLYYDTKYLYSNQSKAKCTGTTQPSSVVGDTTNSFCIDPNHIAPLTQYYTDVANGALASFTFIESGSINDEHPGSGQSVLYGQAEMAKILNAFMTSASWSDSAFFFSYDEGGGPYDHVPPVPGHSNDNTDKSMLPIPDIKSISVNPDSYFPCRSTTGTATQHCDLKNNYPGTHPGDAATVNGFAAQIGFRVPNFVVSPFTRRHYVSHIPMDHTAVMRFVEDRFIGNHQYLTNRDAAQPDLLDFFDFDGVPWATPPTPPNPVTASSLGYNPCTPKSMGP